MKYFSAKLLFSTHKRTLALMGLLIAISALNGCQPSKNEAQKSTRSFDDIKASGVLQVITRNAPTTYYLDRAAERAGPEYDMALAFASHHNLKLEIIEKTSIGDVIQAVENGEGDLAAAGLTKTETRTDLFRFGPDYQDVTQQVVCRRDNVQPESVDELIGLNIRVAANTSYSERLNAIKQDHPELSWEESVDSSTEELLYQVWKRNIDCTVADSNIVDLNRRYFPELIAPFNLARSESLVWMMSHERQDLQDEINTWFNDYKSSGRLAALQEEYYGFFEVFDYVDTRKLIQRVYQRLPKYTDYFKQASEQYKIPYELLVAQAYQESHWRANAKSPTGVRGIMMLTLNTAKSMGVTNRLDPKQSIFGGAKYLAQLRKERFVEEVQEPDRTWLALAAYNIGRAHLHDAQSLARQLDLSPYHWRDIKQVLPLMTEKRYYKDLKYGYARGTEPVRYVQRIREYEHIIQNELEK